MTAPGTLLEYFTPRLDGGVELVRRLVELESHSYDKPGIDALAEFLAAEFARLGTEVEIIPSANRGNLLRAVWSSGATGKPVLVLGHLDTVWPRGTLRDRPFRLADGKAFGPGVFDMKSGIALCLLLCQALGDRRFAPAADVVFFFTSDEEIGTGAGLEHLRAVAAGCRAVLCLEPSLPGGRAKTFRNGVGSFRVRVEGIAAHAGVDHKNGANAIEELSRVVLWLSQRTDYARGLTLSVGTITGGSAVNVVPAAAEAEVDFRVSSVADASELERAVRALAPTDARCRVVVEGGLNRPPLERTPAVVALYELAHQVAGGIGMDLGEGSTGGGSDGSFTAALGIPTLDGLGVEGEGAHAVHESIVVSDIPRRAALLGVLLERLGSGFE